MERKAQLATAEAVVQITLTSLALRMELPPVCILPALLRRAAVMGRMYNLSLDEFLTKAMAAWIAKEDVPPFTPEDQRGI